MCQVVTREVNSWKPHIDGLDRILVLRGGLDSLSAASEYVKHKVIGYVLGFCPFQVLMISRFRLYWLYKQMSLGTVPEFAQYPDHPFPPDLCIPISKLPDDLAELALDGCLNIHLIKLMAPVFNLGKTFKTSGRKDTDDLRRLRCLAYEMEELFSISDLTPLEQLLTVALIDYCITLDGQRRQHWLLVGACQINCTRILYTGFEYDNVPHDLLIWIGSMYVACGEPSLQSARLGQKILSRCRKAKFADRQAILEACQKMVWDDFLTQKLDSKFDFDVVSSDSPSSIATSSSSQSPEQPPKCWTISPEPVT